MDDHRSARCANEFQMVPIAVRPAGNVAGSSRLRSAPRSDGTVLLCLHQWGVEDHPSLTSPDDGTPGNGLLLFFRVDDYEMALRRARTLVARLEEEPHVNPNTRTKEFSLRDPDGYYVTISALSALERRNAASQRPNKRLQPTKTRGRPPRLRGRSASR